MAVTINASTSAGLVQTADTSGVLALQTAGTTAVTVAADQSVTFAQAANLPNTFGFKNRIINGAMVISQRNGTSSVSATGGGQYFLDRWSVNISAGSKFTVAQSSTAPTGFNNSSLITSSSAYSITSGDFFAYQQFIEGYNIADLGWGTASASTVTLSFWVRSSLTGTFGGALANSTNTVSATRSYPFTYTISSANTWEQKTLTIAGDTSGTWGTTNAGGIAVLFGLGVGSTYSGTAGAWAGSDFRSATGATSVVGTNGATWYVTGVQLEKGSTATSFDYRPYTTELQLCQRYYYKVVGTSSYPTFGAGAAISTTEGRIAVQYPVQMRATPTISYGGTVLLTASNGNGVTVTAIASNYGNETGGMLGVNVASGITAGDGTIFITQSGSSSNFIQASIEL